jgi:signal transduction histidine kinase
MVEQHQIEDSVTYQGADAPPESLDLHFVPFAQGMLYVGSIAPLEEKELELARSLAKAFSIAYARYEDFVKLERAKSDIESTLQKLRATQTQLVQQEKLASLGQLTAGIAHEIKNPLNFVNNFSEVNLELIQEALAEVRKETTTRDIALIDELLGDIQSNLQKVYEHGSRANGIVNSMLQHSRGGSGQMEPTHLNAFLKEYVKFCVQGMRAGKHPIPLEVQWDLADDVSILPIIREDFSRVIINITGNAFDAMRNKLNMLQLSNDRYEPLLIIRTEQDHNHVRLSFQDNGPGIPEDIKDKIMQPFFTTKKGTEGTGLGLSITHDIIKAHGGELRVQTTEAGGSTFIIHLPVEISS